MTNKLIGVMKEKDLRLTDVIPELIGAVAAIGAVVMRETGDKAARWPVRDGDRVLLVTVTAPPDEGGGHG